MKNKEIRLVRNIPPLVYKESFTYKLFIPFSFFIVITPLQFANLILSFNKCIVNKYFLIKIM